ncbi:hypothetical protein KAU33_13460 [Candidatus Dependentiae bacterium]|nr:hypothetical protein [Candidatus Dependentiae bacterium]
MDINIKKDIDRGILIIKRLVDAYKNRKLFKFNELPENNLPEDLEVGSNEHLLYLSFVSGIAYLRREERLWAAARETYDDENLRYVFNPKEVIRHPLEEVESNLKEYGLFINLLVLKHWSIGKLKTVDRRSLRENDLEIWLNHANTLNDFSGDIKTLFESYDNNALKVFRAFTKLPYSSSFPTYHKPRKVEIWLARIRRYARFEIKNMNELPMPVGAHIIRATFLPGAISGELNSIHVDLDSLISDYWHEVAEVGKEELGLSPIEFQVFLWTLSKYGCSVGREGETCSLQEECPLGDICSKGKFNVMDTYISINLEQV